MAYRTVGVDGEVTSWGSANFYSTMLARLTPVAIDWDENNDPIEVAALGTDYDTNIPSVRSWRATLRARAFATPRIGNVGTVTFSAGGYALHVRRWSLTIEAQVHDITELASSPASGPTWRDFRPDRSRISGTISCHADSGTVPVNTHAIGASAPTLTLVYGDSATDEQLSGAAILSQLSGSVSRGSQNTLDYSFVQAGQWTPAGTNSFLGSTALGIPIWSEGGSAVGAIVWATKSTSTAKTATGTDSFWTSINITCEVDQPVEVSIAIQGVGALTYA